MINMDPTRLPSYLRGATDTELATLAQQARSPDILKAVQSEMDRRGQGELTDAEMATPAPSLADVASEEWMPPWQRDKRSPFITQTQYEGPVPDDSGPAFESGGTGAPGSAIGKPNRPSAVRPPEMEELPELDVGYAPGVGPRQQEDADIPPAVMRAASALEKAGEDPDVMAGLLKEIQGGIQSPEESRRMAIARAGFAMAGSRNPYFFGALGEGATAGLDAYEKSRQEALLNRVRSANLQQDENKFAEQKRATGVSEKDAAARLSLAERNVKLAEDDYALKKQQYEEGKATDAQLKAAEVRLRQAQAKYYEERPTTTARPDLLTDKDGNVFTIQDGKATYVTDEKGNRVKGTKVSGSGSGLTALQKNAKYYGDLFYGGDEAAGARLLQQGKTMSPDVRRRTALQMATALAASDPTLIDPIEKQTFIDEQAAQIEADLEAAASTGAPAEAPPAAPTSGEQQTAPVYTSPEQVKKDYQDGKLSKEEARKLIQGMAQ